MRVVRGMIVCVLALVMSGCAIWDKETNNRGGYFDDLADRHFMKADSKRMRALRALAIQVSLTRIASVAPKNDADRQLLAVRIGSTTRRANYVIQCAYGNNPLAVAGAESDPCFYFDSAMVDYATSLYDLAMLALPFEEGKKLVSSVAGAITNPLDALQVLTSLIDIGREAFKYGRVVGAIYRDAVELEVQVWLDSPRSYLVTDRTPVEHRITDTHVQALRAVYDRGNDNLKAWKEQIAALREKGLEPVPHPKFILELQALMSYLCGLITKDEEPLKQCVGTPASVSAVRPAVSTAASVARATSFVSPAPRVAKGK